MNTPDNEHQAAVQRAIDSIEQHRAHAERDPSRPRCHFHPPALWMNDPNGTIWHDGWYHLFYQCNPYGESWGLMHWGHARSRDMVRWEHLPVALAPATQLGEQHCYSGCAALRPDGHPGLLYTSIGERDPEQWLALSGDMTVWERYAGNPVVSMHSMAPMRVKEWRDPFVFSHEGRTFMLTGCKLLDRDGGEAACLIHEALSAELTEWTFRGVFYRHPNISYPHYECPNICRLGDRWLLLSAFELHTVEYAIGDIDWDTLTFRAESHGYIDTPGEGKSALYATNLLRTPDERTILFAWVRGFREGAGWNGVQSFPRELRIENGALVQTPARELESLRTMHAALGPLTIDNESRVLDMVEGDSLEIILSADISAVETFSIELRRSADGIASVPVTYHDGALDINHIPVPVPASAPRGRLDLRIFLDKSIMEVFAWGGLVCATRIVYKRENDLDIAVSASGGPAIIDTLDIWKLKSDGVFA